MRRLGKTQSRPAFDGVTFPSLPLRRVPIRLVYTTAMALEFIRNKKGDEVLQM